MERQAERQPSIVEVREPPSTITREQRRAAAMRLRQRREEIGLIPDSVVDLIDEGRRR